MDPIVPVILCGGSGTRLWPKSRVHLPKPFLPLVGTQTLFEAALARCPAEAGFAPPLVVAGAAHADLVEAQWGLDGGGAPGARLIIEPMARNTAAAIALAAHALPDDAIMLVCPSDHHIGNVPAFIAAAHAAAALAGEGWLVSFGIAAQGPETGYGYLKRGAGIGDLGFRVERFVEKPDLARAQAFLADGGYAWNGGIFAFRVGTFLAELAAHRPAIHAATQQAMAAARSQGARLLADAQAFAAIKGESVDYAVMENTTRAAMVPADMEWSDIGNWQALHAAREQDAQGNSLRGPADLIDCRKVLVDSDGPRVSVVALEGVIVVVNGGEVLVTSAEGAQLVGKLPGAASQ